MCIVKWPCFSDWVLHIGPFGNKHLSAREAVSWLDSIPKLPISQCRYNYTTTFINFVAFISFIQDVQESLRSHLTCHLPSVASSYYCPIRCTFPSSDLGNVPGVYVSGASISKYLLLTPLSLYLAFWIICCLGIFPRTYPGQVTFLSTLLV